MKKWILLMGGIALAVSGMAQTFSEWFRQHKTQIKYLHQQIIALQALKEDTEKGNTIVQQGTHVIGWLLQLDQDQHRNNFIALKAVGRLVQEDGRIGTARAWQNQVTLDCQASLKASETGGYLRTNEREIVRTTVNDLMERAMTYGAVLDRISGGGYLVMRDDERLQRLQEVYDCMKRLLFEAGEFRQQLEEMILVRRWGIMDADGLRSMYGLNYPL